MNLHTLGLVLLILLAITEFIVWQKLKKKSKHILPPYTLREILMHVWLWSLVITIVYVFNYLIVSWGSQPNFFTRVLGLVTPAWSPNSPENKGVPLLLGVFILYLTEVMSQWFRIGWRKKIFVNVGILLIVTFLMDLVFYWEWLSFRFLLNPSYTSKMWLQFLHSGKF